VLLHASFDNTIEIEINGKRVSTRPFPHFTVTAKLVGEHYTALLMELREQAKDRIVGSP
jgi:hypothetical protein